MKHEAQECMQDALIVGGERLHRRINISKQQRENVDGKCHMKFIFCARLSRHERGKISVFVTLYIYFLVFFLELRKAIKFDIYEKQITSLPLHRERMGKTTQNSNAPMMMSAEDLS